MANLTVEEARKVWIEALRSGKYKQAKRYLKVVEQGETEPGYCCLGLACELYQQFEGDLRVNGGWNPLKGLTYTSFDSIQNVLPEKVQKWLGIRDKGQLNQEFPIPADCIDSHKYDFDLLTALNDTGYTFEQIADIIEQGHVLPLAA